jgi:uncharacterized protein (TIGR02588 family)
MAARKPSVARAAPAGGPVARSLIARTPLAEWIAAGLGLLLTLAVIGFLVVEGVRARGAAPDLSVEGGAAVRGAGGFSVPVTVRNAGHATAAAVQVSGTLARGGAVVERRGATFAYVPGRGQASGGLIFERDPAGFELTLRAEGYEDP